MCFMFQSGILTDRECVSLFLHFTVNPKPPVGFLDVPRYKPTYNSDNYNLGKIIWTPPYFYYF